VAEETTPEVKPKKGGALMTMIVALASLAVGGGAGIAVVGPMFAGGGEKTESHGEEKDGHGGGGGHGGGSADALWQIDNLVVNPRETQGTRFLVVGIAVRMSDGTQPQNLQGGDPEVRDAVLGLLSGMTVDELSDPASRDALKKNLKDVIEGVIGKGRVASVLLPQFVLQ
jgi:flagellar basal body-associated protein FliL